jgi:hypothetical protein
MKYRTLGQELKVSAIGISAGIVLFSGWAMQKDTSPIGAVVQCKVARCS